MALINAMDGPPANVPDDVSLVVSSLIQLKNDMDKGMVSPERVPSAPKPELNVTPPRGNKIQPLALRLSGVKRKSEDSLVVVYQANDDAKCVLTVPFVRGESESTLIQRRDERARVLFCPKRGKAFCTWRHSMVSILVNDARWVMFRDSLQQKRYQYGSIQMITTRYTCTQWRECQDPCRNCQNRHFRTACLKPTYLFHIMPLPAARGNVDACETCVADMGMIVLEDEDVDQWKSRTPQISVR